MFIEGAVLTQYAVDFAAEAGGEGLGVERSGEVALVEERDYFVAGLKSCDVLADAFDCAAAIGAGDYWEGMAEGVLAAGYEDVAVVQAGGVDLVLLNLRALWMMDVYDDLHLTRTSLSPS